ncbi:hypothetical protein [Streptomyces alboniger]|nr:hypothetical protein [Streptomyces alboniger]
MSDTAPRLEPLNKIMITSRDFSEYLEMFGLTENDVLAGPVLDCAAGASDFALRARGLGASVVSVDPLYDRRPDELRGRVLDELDIGELRAREAPQLYDLSWAGGLDGYLGMRRSAATAFLDDYERAWSGGGPRPYQPAALPDLPFGEGQFRLGLVPNLLFTYANLFDRDWHRAALLELLRVCDEVRVHPLTDTSGRFYPELDLLLAELAERGAECQLIDVDYRLRRERSRTLVCRKGQGSV